MASENQNATISEGVDKTITFTVTGTDATTATALSYKAWIGDTVLFSKTKAGGGITTPDSSTAIVTIEPADTALRSAMLHRHELRVTDASTNLDVVSRGTLTINPAPPVAP